MTRTLVAHFRKERPAGPIACELSVSMAEDTTLVLFGPSGAGKTTVLRCLAGLDVPETGSVRFDGERWLENGRAIPPQRRGIGYVAQGQALFPHLTVARNVGLVPELERWPAERIAARVDELLDLVGLPPIEYARRYPHELSGGQRQRVGVARALAADPPLVLLDEPFGALDPITRAELQREFRALQARLRKTAVFVTHDMREAGIVADRIALVDAGRLVALGTLAELRTAADPTVRAFLEA